MDQDGVFVYTVQNTSAADLGALVAQVLPAQVLQPREGAQEAPRGGRPALSRPASGAARTGAPEQAEHTGRITVDAGGNRLLFRGSASEFEKARAIMAQLDTSPQQVLVEITIAEVTLTDETRFGVDWYLQQTIGSAGVSLDTRGGSSREAGGLGATYSRVFSRGRVEAALNAIAENRNLNILSTPRLVARSGSEAQILVGNRCADHHVAARGQQSDRRETPISFRQSSTGRRASSSTCALSFTATIAWISSCFRKYPARSRTGHHPFRARSYSIAASRPSSRSAKA